MPNLNLTDLAVRQLSFSDDQVTYWDTTIKGFGLRVSRTTKTFIVMRGKERTRISLGRYPETSLKTARASAIMEMAETPSTPRKTFLEACSAFERDMTGKVKPDTLKQYMAYLEAMHFDQVSDITYSDITEALEKWNTKPFAQNYAYASIRNLLNWCLEHQLIDKHPLFRKKPPNKVKSRDRVLTDSELARIWRCTDNNAYGRILRLLILTGQRRIEVRNLQPEDVSDVITFNTKGDKINVLPITPLLRENLQLPFVFNDWSRSKVRFDTDCGVDFRLHDIRRSFATGLAKLGVSPYTIERLLGHSMGTVESVYQRYSFLKEKEEALLIWERHIKTISLLES